MTGLGFVKGNPSQVVADIDVTNASAPINADTKAQLETQGLTGSATVALIGGEKGGELTGNPPVIPSLPTATLADLQTKAGYVLDLANKLLVDNAQPIHKTIENVETFSLALANNSGGVDAALKGLADLGKTIEPLANRLQALSDDADALVKAIDTDKVRAIVDNVQALSGKANSVLSRADKLLADNSGAIDSTISNVSAVSKTLSDNRSNIDATLKGFADLGKQIEPLAQRLQSLSEDADKLVKAIDTEKLRGVVDNANTFSKALAASAGDYQAVMRDGAAFVSKLNDTSKQLDTAISDIDNIVKAVDPSKVSGVVDSISDVATTVRQNRGNIDQTIKNATEMMAKLNESADKIDGLITSAQSFIGSPGNQGRADAARRRGAVGQEACRRPRRSGEGDFRRPQPVQQFGPAPVRGARRSGATGARGHRSDGPFLQAESKSAHLGSETFAAGISHGTVMRKAGGQVRRRFLAGSGAALALALAGCASAPSDDL